MPAMAAHAAPSPGTTPNSGATWWELDRASSLLIEPLCSAVTEIPQVECRALVALYNGADGPHWANRNGWLINEHAVYISLVRYRVRQRPRQYPGAKAQ